MQRLNTVSRTSREDIIRLYLCGLDAGDIAGRTGLRRFNVRLEIERATARDPQLLERHLKARYPSQRRKLRFPGATILIDPREQTRSVGEY